ncbi:MAG: VanZ family protein [Gammaproteobacteria bacterium]|nr:VanZ family protein [Gammaproteobacteria bacterium]
MFMFARAVPDLKLRFLWLTIGYALVALVVFLSLTSSPVDLELGFPLQDKLFHALAYFTLMAWFSQIYHDRFQRNMIAVVFVLMGVTLEYLQGFDPNRYFEIADMIANSIGVALGFSVALTSAKNILVRVEQVIGY